jgi:hypothetical protein
MRGTNLDCPKCGIAFNAGDFVHHVTAPVSAVPPYRYETVTEHATCERLIARVHKRNENGDPIVILVDDRAFIAATHLQNAKVK